MVKKVLNHLETSDFGYKIKHIETIEPRPANYGIIDDLPDNIQKYLDDSLIKPYEHQAKAIELIREGKNVLITTPTASGKTLSFNLPIIESLSQDPDATALYIYPAKALTNDQLRVLRHLEESCGLDIKPNIYDGDTPKDLRPWIKDNSRIILTNPYMIHLILSWHHQWARFYTNLKYIVIDEAHHYRGVFGSNVAFLIRRLRRICNYYGSDPQFILSSATLANPDEFSEKLVGKKFELIDKDTSPSGRKYFVLYDPYLKGGELSTHQETKNLFQFMVQNNLQTLCFTASRRMAELIAMWSRKELNESRPDLVEKITAYRAGYLAEDRRKIENDLKSGELVGVTCTNALELGVDIGSLDAVIISGYPGTMISTWQQAGRAGRGENDSLVIMISFENPLDQYLMNHPEFIFSKTHENAVINLQNEKIINSHLLCATSELPLTFNELKEFFVDDESFLKQMEEKRIIRKTKEGWIYLGRGNPAFDTKLDQISESKFKVMHNNHLLEEMDRQHAYMEAHDGAVLINQGQTYIVDDFDNKRRIITVKKMDVDYHTQTLHDSEIKIIKKLNHRSIGYFDVFYGDLEVTQTFLKYKMMLYGKILSVHDLDLPPIKYKTKGLWFTLPGTLIDILEKNITGTDIYAGSLHGTEHALIAMFPLLVMCDRYDIGGLSTTYHPETGAATIFIHDAYEDGIGLTEKAVELMEKLVEVTRDMVKNCDCSNGCPSCIYSPKCGNDNKPLNKLGTLFILESIKKLMNSKEISNDLPKNIETNTQTINKPTKISLSADAYQEFESPDKLIKKGESFYSNGNLSEALICFQDALKLDKKNFKALKFQGMILELDEKHAEAIRSFQMALEIESNDEETLYFLAVSFYNTDKCQESKEISQKLIKLKSDWDDAWYVLGISLQSLGDEKGAIQAYSKALGINPLNEDAAENLKDLLNN